MVNLRVNLFNRLVRFTNCKVYRDPITAHLQTMVIIEMVFFGQTLYVPFGVPHGESIQFITASGKPLSGVYYETKN